MTAWSTEGWDLPDPARLRAALNLLDVACAPGAAVADLGCLHGAYSRAFARAGYQVTGIEARAENIAACRQAIDLPGLRYIQDDVRNLATHGPFDAVFCCGLLYHLDEPVKFLTLLGQVTRRLLIIQTHYALETADANEGHPGSWYTEQDPDNPWASWGNRRSFWLTKPALLGAVQDAGFNLVCELHDQQADICGSPSRGMFAAVKTEPGIPPP
jgi:SAM-dependent methyltransferase